MKYWLLFGVVVLGFWQACCLKITDLKVPEYMDLRENATISCNYELGDAPLNSLKIYVNGLQIFRYSPTDSPAYNFFPIFVLKVRKDNLNCDNSSCSLELSDFRKTSTFSFACEVSEDAPTFKTVIERAHLTVLYLPKKDPIIEGTKAVYKMGDLLNATCISDFSSLPTILIWSINGRQRRNRNESITETEEGKGLTFMRQKYPIELTVGEKTVDPIAKTIELKCTAEIGYSPLLHRETILTVKVSTVQNIDEAFVSSKNWLVSKF